MPTISGTVYDDTGEPVNGRIVRAYRRDNGSLIGSASTGVLNAVDEHYNNVSLLLFMDGTNSSTTFLDSSPRLKTVTAFDNTQISTAQSKFGGASGLFDGAGDYLSVPAGVDFQFGSGDFTIEAWVRPTSGVVGNQCIYWYGNDGNFFNNVSLHFSDGVFNGYVWGSSEGVMASSVAAPAGQWHHVALVRSGLSLRVFVGGVGGASQTIPQNPSVPGMTFVSIGALYGNLFRQQFFAGHIDELRVTKGVARYTADFAPPVAPFFPYALEDPNFGQVSYLLEMEGADGSTTITDSSALPKTATCFGSAQISTAQSRFGTSSLRIPTRNTGSYLALQPLSSMAADFTIEFWLNLEAPFPGSNQDIIGLGFGSWFIYTTSAGAMRLWTGSDSIDSGDWAIGGNSWFHIALCRSSSNIRLFINGTQRGATFTNSSDLSGGINLARGSAGQTRMLGNFDNVRITSFARYTSNFTTPTEPFGKFVPTAGGIGEYIIPTNYTGECNVLCLDDTAGTVYEDLCRRATPA